MDLSLLPRSASSQDFFRRNAYLLVEGALSPEVCESLKQKALHLADAHARAIQRAAGNDVLRYRVVTGEVIEQACPELFRLYCHPELRSWIATVTGTDAIALSSHRQSAININVLAEPGEVYRWHFDAVPYTLLLYLSSSQSEDGGALEFYPNAKTGHPPADAVKVSYLPRAGDFVLMDGTRCFHRVAPVLQRHLRISVPMVFPATANHARPSDLDQYLYDRAA